MNPLRIIATGKLSDLLSSPAKQHLASEALYHIQQSLQKASNYDKILEEFNVVPSGLIMAESWHQSKSESRIHLTVDVYSDDPERSNVDKPIGVLHCFKDGNIAPFASPRHVALMAYLKVTEKYDASREAEKTIAGDT